MLKLEKNGENGTSQKERGRGRGERRFFSPLPLPSFLLSPSYLPLRLLFLLSVIFLRHKMAVATVRTFASPKWAKPPKRRRRYLRNYCQILFTICKYFIARTIHKLSNILLSSKSFWSTLSSTWYTVPHQCQMPLRLLLSWPPGPGRFCSVFSFSRIVHYFYYCFSK